MNSKNRSFYIVALIIATLCNYVILNAQTYVPGTTYTDATGYVEYRAGNLPIIISAPHGGYLEPTTIPDRNCTGCSTVRDAFTQEVTDGLYNAIVAQTGCYPHVIINLLHRKKFDANRDVGDASNGNPIVTQSWNNYHDFINISKNQVIQDYGSGTFYDIHGHGHSIQRIELGYLLSRSELQQSDQFLNTDPSTQDSSIRTLASNNLQNLTQAQLIRGTNSFGDILVNRGYPTVPSSTDLAPQGTDPYFAGGYNTRRHGSSASMGPINAIQIELNSTIRFDAVARTALINSLTDSMLDFHTLHYNAQFSTTYCSVLSNRIPDRKQIKIHPVPAVDRLHITTDLNIKSYSIYDIAGKVISQNNCDCKHINIFQLKSGIYFLKLYMDSGSLESFKFVKTDP